MVADHLQKSGSSHLQKSGSNHLQKSVVLQCFGWLRLLWENSGIWVLLGMMFSCFHVSQIDPMTIKQGIDLLSNCGQHALFSHELI
jgi:hypothetical protein